MKDEMLNALLHGLISMYIYRIGTKHSLYRTKKKLLKKRHVIDASLFLI